MTSDFGEQARKAAKKRERERLRAEIKMDECAERRCDLCPFSSRERCRKSGVGCE